MENSTEDSGSLEEQQGSLLPKGILYPETNDTAGVAEEADRKKAFASILRARKKRRPLQPLLEKYLPLPFRKVYYDFSVGGYLVIFFVVFGAIIGLGVLGAAIIGR